jgi:hypothetical protein
MIFPLFFKPFNHFKIYFMARRVSENEGYGSVSREREGDLAAKGGPASGLGKADNDHRISKPYKEDIQTQIAAKSKKNKKIRKN